MGGVIYAQPTADDVRVIKVLVETTSFNTTVTAQTPSERLHNQVYLDVTFNGTPNGNITCNPGNGLPLMMLVAGMNGPINYPASNTPHIRTLIFELNSIGSTVFVGQCIFTNKPTYTVGNLGMVPPDEVWPIESSATWEPPQAGAFACNNLYNGNALSGATAYIKFSPLSGNKLKKPFIFVEGIDFGKSTVTYEGETIRHGSVGWDVLMMGNDAGETNPYDPDQSEFKDYPASINALLAAGFGRLVAAIAVAVERVVRRPPFQRWNQLR